jgi:hypothetical protein
MARTANRTDSKASRATETRPEWMHALEPLPLSDTADAGVVHQLEPLRAPGPRRLPLKPEPRRRRNARI